MDVIYYFVFGILIATPLLLLFVSFLKRKYEERQQQDIRETQ